MKPDLRPPWIIFSDQGKPIAILPAGRPGEVADVRGMKMKDVRRIVAAANAGYVESSEAAMERITDKLLELEKKIKESPFEPSGT